MAYIYNTETVYKYFINCYSVFISFIFHERSVATMFFLNFIVVVLGHYVPFDPYAGFIAWPDDYE